MVDSAKPTARRNDTDDPRGARELALKILFQADIRGTDAAVMLDKLDAEPQGLVILNDPDARTSEDTNHRRGPGDRVDAFTRSLVRGVATHLSELDQLISRFARRWQISRMPAVDRCVLRLATYELLHESTPPAVVIDEAVNLAKALSTDDSGRYVNGVLESIRKDIATGTSPNGPVE